MSKLMLIDAAHPEETRVAVVTDDQVDDFDFETEGKKQLRGNIYLAKVTRVEPSLQAAFVEYGGNRHGFLAFSEIHPDYYQLPQADREALLKAAAEEAAELDDDDYDDEDDEEAGGDVQLSGDSDEDDDEGDEDARAHARSDDDDDDDEGDDEDESAGSGDASVKSRPASRGRGPQRKKRPPRNSHLKNYKIQEVIRRRQVMLVQVAKEERGNKGAALTTYLSLAGRYSVLMPNTPRGGGISRKIANGADRKRLKAIVGEFEMPEGMGLIVRTAGAKRTKAEIKRDYDYLTKLWDNIREKTLTSIAPCLVNEEGGLVHRAMRDMFDKDLEEVLIQGEEAYREAKDLAKLIMPSQARKVQQWTEPEPLFVAQGIDEQLDSIFRPEVRLKSGGYLVINQTEALVAIDVNSGKSTKERNIEQTALRTNMEAAEEACRQMRLRDLAGLVVIDFIDMDENKHNRAIEKAMKDHLKIDRARVQCGRISQFGLMEISRQRRRAGFLQATSDPCPSCNGTGRVRSVESAALQLLRAIEARAAFGGLRSINVEAPTDVALYLLNEKREQVASIESVAGFAITVKSTNALLAGDFTLHAERDPNARTRPRRDRRRRSEQRDTRPDLDVIDEDEDEDEDLDLIVNDEADEAEEKAPRGGDDSDEESGSGRKRRRRGRRGGRRRRKGPEETDGSTQAEDAAPLERIDPDSLTTRKGETVPEDGGAFLDGVSLTAMEMLDNPETAEQELADAVTDTVAVQGTRPTDEAPEGTEGDGPRKPRRRRRGGRGRSRRGAGEAETDGSVETDDDTDTGDSDEPDEAQASPVEEVAPEEVAPVEAAPDPTPDPTPEPVAEAARKAAAEPEAKAEPVAEPAPEPRSTAPESVAEPADSEDKKPSKRGWWSRRRA